MKSPWKTTFLSLAAAAIVGLLGSALLWSNATADGKDEAAAKKTACSKPAAKKPAAKKPEEEAPQIDPMSVNATCYVCHVSFVQEKISSAHFEAKVTCVECHGLSAKHANDENIGATKPDIVYKHKDVDKMCEKCHEDHDVAPRKVVARFVERKLPAKKVPLCTDCHGTHRIEREVNGTRGDEAHTEKIIAEILSSKQNLLAGAADQSSDQFVFLAFWDFDGTILKGDCTEGLKLGDGPIYAGLAQLTIEAGYSQIYSPQGGVAKFWIDYSHMEHDIGKWLAYPYVAQMLRGAKESDVRALSGKHFAGALSGHYFESSVRILKALEDNKIGNYIISASPDVFLDAAAPTLGLPSERFNGIEVKIENGRLTEKTVHPVTWSDGKTEKLICIVEETRRRHPGKRVVVLAAFGNSYGTDGPFMKYVATQTLPKGKPLAVMINGGEAPAAYRGLFTQVQQSAIVRAR